MTDRIKWETVKASVGPDTTYGEWTGIRCFSIFYGVFHRDQRGPRYVIKCTLPGFRKDLPPQVDVESAKAFAEKMLVRWVARRGLLFKDNITVTDAMKEAVRLELMVTDNPEALIRAALAAREPRPT